jgi:hypothetical protein
VVSPSADRFASEFTARDASAAKEGSQADYGCGLGFQKSGARELIASGTLLSSGTTR